MMFCVAGKIPETDKKQVLPLHFIYLALLSSRTIPFINSAWVEHDDENKGMNGKPVLCPCVFVFVFVFVGMKKKVGLCGWCCVGETHTYRLPKRREKGKENRKEKENLSPLVLDGDSFTLWV